MSRPRTEHGKRVPLSVKVSEPKAQAVDARRGILSRAAYLESLIDADLAGFTGKPESAPRRARLAGPDPGGQQRVIDDVMTRNPDGSPRKKAAARTRRPVPVADGAPEPVPGVEFETDAVPVTGRVRCPHPGTRVIGGWCPRCGVVVGSDGYLP